MRPHIVCVVAIAALGCSAASKDAALLDTATESDAGGTGGEVDTGESAEPTWWRLDADLLVSAGQLSRDGSQLTVSILDPDGLVLCEEEVRLASTDTIVTRPEPELLTWWAVELGEGTRTCAATYDVSVLPRDIQLGVGEMHPELQAVAGLVDGMPDTGVVTLNAAYARVDSDIDDVWVYGFAGDDGAWLGVSGPATVAPLTDGMWTLRGIYSFPLPSDAR